MMMSLHPSMMRLAIIMLLAMAGCRSASPPVSYYSLNAVDVKRQAAAREAPTIGVGPITLPDYLDRPQMVVRTGPHELRIDDYHLWGAPLSQELARVLTENLLMLTGSPRVARMPWGHRFEPEVRIGIQVFNFEASADRTVRLRAAVTMTDRRTGKERSWTADLVEPAERSTHAELAAALSRIVAELSRRIAQAINAE